MSWLLLLLLSAVSGIPVFAQSNATGDRVIRAGGPVRQAYLQTEPGLTWASRGTASTERAQELLKAAENPLPDLITFPVQSSTNFNIGQYERIQNEIRLEPVVPVRLSSKWILATRVIQPITWEPYFDQKSGGTVGFGDTKPTFFLSPNGRNALIWGAGPALVVPTATSGALGQGKLSLGPSLVVVAQPRQWTMGALVSNVWSVAGSGNRPAVNEMSLQYLVSYNLPHEWYLTSSPTITSNWRGSAGNVWTVPLGAGVGKLVVLGNKSLDLSGEVDRNAMYPAGASTWCMSLGATFLFPQTSKWLLRRKV